MRADLQNWDAPPRLSIDKALEVVWI